MTQPWFLARIRLKELSMWLPVAALGALLVAGAISVRRAWTHNVLGPIPFRDEEVQLAVLGVLLIGTSVAGVVLRWGPFIPTFLIAFIFFVMLIPASDSSTEAVLLFIALGFAGVVAVWLDRIYHARRASETPLLPNPNLAPAGDGEATSQPREEQSG